MYLMHQSYAIITYMKYNIIIDILYISTKTVLLYLYQTRQLFLIGSLIFVLKPHAHKKLYP